MHYLMAEHSRSALVWLLYVLRYWWTLKTASHEFQEIGDSGRHFQEELIIVTEFYYCSEEETTGRKYSLVPFFVFSKSSF